MDPRVRHLYKNLLYMGRDYPLGLPYFREKLHAAFIKQRYIKKEEELVKALENGEYVIKELEALYFLSRYRNIKKKYYEE